MPQRTGSEAGLNVRRLQLDPQLLARLEWPLLLAGRIPGRIEKGEPMERRAEPQVAAQSDTEELESGKPEPRTRGLGLMRLALQ